MTLSDYLSQNEITRAAFAVRVGVAPSTISRLCRGQTRPEGALVAAIARATGGAVLPNDLFPDAVAPTETDRPADAVQHANDDARRRGAAGTLAPVRHERVPEAA